MVGASLRAWNCVLIQLVTAGGRIRIQVRPEGLLGQSGSWVERTLRYNSALPIITLPRGQKLVYNPFLVKLT